VLNVLLRVVLKFVEFCAAVKLVNPARERTDKKCILVQIWSGLADR